MCSKFAGGNKLLAVSAHQRLAKALGGDEIGLGTGH